MPMTTTGHMASMGPRPCGRGRRAISAAVKAACACFNGATALRPWTGQRRRLPDSRRPASMGPRPCGRGRGGRVYDYAGGAVVLQWGHGLAAVDGPWMASTRSTSTSCFNGATALRPWTVASTGGLRVSSYELQWGHGLAAVDGVAACRLEQALELLQWGHGLAAVDGARRHRAPKEGARASMGPQPCGRGRRSPCTGFRAAAGASMGPRPCGRGRIDRPPRPRAAPAASMGPRPCGRGRRSFSWSGMRGRSRSFNGATALRPWTGQCTFARSRLHARASMGPRPCGRGRLARRPPLASGRRASMGPRPCGRGRRMHSRSESAP